MNILIADDDVTTRLSLSLIAEKWGYSVTSVNNGMEIIRILQNKRIAPPKLFILDWEMPEMDGLDVCRELRKNPLTKSAYIIMLTMKNDKNDVLKGLEAGADDYLTKPFSPLELKARIKTGERIVELQDNLAQQITELKTTINKLRKTEDILHETKDYRNLFKHANDPIMLFNPQDQTVLNVNNKACETYQIPRESFIGMSVKKIVPDYHLHEKMVKAVNESGKAEEFEITHLRADEKPMNMRINSALVEFNGHQAILSVNRDVSDRHEIEAIERALKEWKDTVDALSDMIILTDGETKIRRCNQATSVFFKQNYNNLIGKKLNEICHFDNSNERFSRFVDDPSDEQIVTPLNVKSWEGQFADHPHEWYEVTNHRVLISTSNGNQDDYWVHIIKNITERKQSEASLNLLKTGVEYAADSIIVTDKKGKIEYVNPAFINCVGWTQSEIIGNELLNLQASELNDILRDENGEFSIPNDVWQGVYHAHRKNGEIYEEEISISPVRHESDNKINNYVAVCRDVTERRRLKSIAEAVNMMQNVGYIFSGIRHELGNPINSVKTALTVLKKNLSKWDTEQVNIYIERCLTETERVEYLLRALKTFSMYENPQIEKVDLIPFISNFTSLIEGDFQKRGIQIKLKADKEIKEALFDPRALHQVLLNLITNAVDALEGCDNRLITVHLQKDKQRIYVSIEDNGCGMNEGQVENLFKPFYTSKESGTGLGLVIVKKMITKMNGTIFVESVPNYGTKVNFTLETSS